MTPLRRRNDVLRRDWTGAQGETRRSAQLLLTLWLVQHAHLLRAAFSACPARVGDDGCFVALRCTLAGELFAPQSLDIQHCGNAYRLQFCDDVCHCSALASG